MAMVISKQDGKRAFERLQSFKSRVAKIRQSAEKTTEKFVRTVEVSGAALGMGIIQGKTGGVEVIGMPIDLLSGVSLSVLGYFGAAGKMSDHLNNLGDGCLAAYFATVGRGIGQQWEAKAALPKSKSEGVTLDPREIDQAARAAISR